MNDQPSPARSRNRARGRAQRANLSLLLVTVLVIWIALRTRQARLDDVLFDATYRDDGPAVERAIERGANPNSELKGFSPIRFAYAAGHWNAVEVLVKHGVSPDVRVTHTEPMLIAAATDGATRCCETLVSAGLDPNTCGSRGDTPLMRAAEGKHAETVALLLAEGSDHTAVDSEGRTALDRARIAQRSAILYPDAYDETIALLQAGGRLKP